MVLTRAGLLVSLLAALLGGTPQSDSTVPQQVRLSFGEDPTRMMRIVWQTSAAPRARLVEYGETDQLGLVATATRATYAYETGNISEATLYRLKPDTTYFYRVGSATDGYSPIRKFRTASVNPSEFIFTAYGDHGISPESVKNVENVVFEKPAFHLLLGDISYANGNQPIWDKYLAQIEPMTSQIPFMIALGNHENEDMKIDGKDQEVGYVSALARFAMPGSEQWYTFDYGNARFVSVNSDDYENPQQRAWLDATLTETRKDKQVKWVIVLQHHPLYGTSKGRGDNEGLIKAFGPIYDKHKVDLVLCGHDHHYERQFPMRAGAIATKQATGYKKGVGTLYIVEGGGGKALYDFTDPKPEKCAVREKANGYLRVTVRRRGPLTFEAKRLDRTLIEKIDIME